MQDKQTLKFICYIYYNGWVAKKVLVPVRTFKSRQCRANVVQMKILTISWSCIQVIGIQLINWIIIKTKTRGVVL